jgi:hypothetical protein
MTAFVQGRNVLDRVVIVHNAVHKLHSKKLNGVILKLDFEKVYDTVKWFFLQQKIRMQGFSEQWHALIRSSMSACREVV